MAQDVSPLILENRIRQLEEKVKRLEVYQKYCKNFLSLNEGQLIFRSRGGAGQPKSS